MNIIFSRMVGFDDNDCYTDASNYDNGIFYIDISPPICFIVKVFDQLNSKFFNFAFAFFYNSIEF